jgi:hypothetical protein
MGKNRKRVILEEKRKSENKGKLKSKVKLKATGGM